MAETLASRSEAGAAAAPSAWQLGRVVCADAPLAAPSRHRLDGVDRVELGRGEPTAAVRDGRTLTLAIADARMSEQHARLRAIAGRWTIEDAGSKNGTRVNGAAVSRAVLGDGDVIECGRTWLVLRDGPIVAGAPADLFAGAELATLSAELAVRLTELWRVAAGATSIVLIGESGTGKEVLARAIHDRSGRGGALVAINCGGLAPGLVEGALFGHRRGAFSGATEDHLGLIRAADRGTLLLDEIGDLPAAAQAALLRVLQEREVTPLGATRPVPVDFRLISIAQRPLEELVAAGRFRADLYARLSGYTFTAPPLRDRLEDLGLLLGALLDRRSAREVTFAPAAMRALVDHDWPLNVRELEKSLDGALARSGGRRIELEHLPPAVQGGGVRLAVAADPISDHDRARHQELEALLRDHGGNVSAIARALGKERVQIRRWLRRLGLDPLHFRRR